MLGRDKISPAATEEPILEQRGCLLVQGLTAVLLSGLTWTHVTLSRPPFPTLPQKCPFPPFLPCHNVMIVLYHGSNK